MVRYGVVPTKLKNRHLTLTQDLHWDCMVVGSLSQIHCGFKMQTGNGISQMKQGEKAALWTHPVMALKRKLMHDLYDCFILF